MPHVHNALHRGDVAAALKNALGVTDPEDGLERFSETLQPVLDLWELPEWAILLRRRLWTAYGSVAAGGAGTVTQIALGTAQTDTLTVIERVFCDVAALATLLTGLSGFGTGLGGTMRDGRMQGILAQTSSFTKNSAVVRSITAGGARLSAGEWTPGPWIVRGSVRQLLVEADALNTAMLVTAMGYEYNILPTERLP